MPATIDATWFLFLPFVSILAFAVFVLWKFSQELRAGKRRRDRRIPNAVKVQIHTPPADVLRFRRNHEKEAA